MWFTIGASFLQLLIVGVIGYVIRVFPEHAKEHRTRYLIGFLTASVAAFVVVAWSAARQDRRQSDLFDTVSGGDSFPVIVPQPWSGERVPLIVWNFGRNPLVGVRISIRCSIFDPMPAENVGTLAPGVSVWLSSPLPSNQQCAESDESQPIKGALTATWMIQLNTQNGGYMEMLQFKWVPACKRWVYRYTVDSMGTVQFDSGKVPKLAKPETRLYGSGADKWVGADVC